MISAGLFGALLLSVATARAEIVFVKYRGPVDLRHFNCTEVNRSSLVHRVCFDSRESYMLINLRGVYYHYCGIDAGTVTGLMNAESMGRYYNQRIRGQFDCRINHVPTYK